MVTLTVCRNVLASALPLAGPPLFERLGLGLGGTVLGCAAVVFVPVPGFWMRFGKRMRGREKLGGMHGT